MYKPSTFAFVLLTAIIWISCGDDLAPVGTGKNFSSVSPAITGDNLLTTFLNNTPTQYDSGGGNPNVVDCTNGGTAELSASGSFSGSGNTGSGFLKINGDYKKCGVTLTLNSKPFTETITGTTRVSATVINSNSGNISIHVGLSFSGDLGFALDCSLSEVSKTGTDGSPTGTCSFRDAAGAHLEVPAANVSFQSFL